MKKFSKILALILSLIMAFSILTVSVAATDGGNVDEPTTDEPTTEEEPTTGDGEQEVIVVGNRFELFFALLIRILDKLFSWIGSIGA